MEYTQEQIDKLIAEATSGLFTEDDLTKRVTAEVDRRVETGIQKGIATQRAKIEQDIKVEMERKAALSAEELVQEQLKLRETELLERESAIKLQANMLEAKSVLAQKGVPKESYEKLIDTLVFDDADKTMSAVNTFAEVFDGMRNEIETKVRTEQSHIPTPHTGEGTKPMTREQFKKLPYKEMLEIKNSDPDLYKAMTK